MMVQLTYFPVWQDDEPGRKTYQCALCTNTSPNRYCDVCASRPGAVRHGYTLADLDRIARLSTHLGSMAIYYRDRRDEAWSAIIEHLYRADQWVAEHDLVWIGRKAIYDLIASDQQSRGYYRAHTDGAAHGAGSSPAFATYWEPLNRPAVSPERHVVERMALWQILPQLREQEREAIIALATHDTYQDAADALGVGYPSFKSQISRARRRFFALWHEGEEPSRPWGCDRRAGVTASDRRAGGGRSAVDAIVRRRRSRVAVGGSTP